MNLERVIALTFLTISIVYGYASYYYPLLPFERNMTFLPNTLPLGLSALGIGLSLILLFAQQKVAAKDDEQAESPMQLPHVVQAVTLVVAMIAFAFALRPLGFVLATLLFLCGAGFVLGERKFHLMIPIAACGALSIWYLVQEVLGIFLRPWPWFV